MVQILGRVSDYALSRILPKATAAACCAPDTYYRCLLTTSISADCFFAGKWQRQRCWDDCNCVHRCTNVSCCNPS